MLIVDCCGNAFNADKFLEFAIGSSGTAVRDDNDRPVRDKNGRFVVDTRYMVIGITTHQGDEDERRGEYILSKSFDTKEEAQEELNAMVHFYANGERVFCFKSRIGE